MQIVRVVFRGLRSLQRVNSARRHQLAYQRPDEDPQVPRKHVPTKRPRLALLGTILTNHRPNRHHAPCKASRKAPRENHLPQILAQPKHRRRDTDTRQTEHQHRFPAQTIRRAAIEDHERHLDEGEEGLDQAGPEADGGLREVAEAEDHFVDEGEDGEVGYGFREGGVAEKEDLEGGHWAFFFLVVSFSLGL